MGFEIQEVKGLRSLRQLRADGGPLGPYGCGHFTYDECEALLTLAEIVASNPSRVCSNWTPVYKGRSDTNPDGPGANRCGECWECKAREQLARFEAQSA